MSDMSLWRAIVEAYHQSPTMARTETEAWLLGGIMRTMVDDDSCAETQLAALVNIAPNNDLSDQLAALCSCFDGGTLVPERVRAWLHDYELLGTPAWDRVAALSS